MNLVSQEIEAYCIDKSTIPSSDCAAIAKHTKANVPLPQMLIGELEASFLGFLIQLVQAKSVLEIGCFTGYSALAMAERLPDDGKLITLDINPDTNKIAQKFWQKSPQGYKIKSILGPALDTLKTLNENFDMVFIDADKENQLAYLEKTLDILNPNGLIVIDNCLWSGRVLDSHTDDATTRAIQKLNDHVKQASDLDVCLLPVRDGMYLIRKGK